MAHIVTWNSTSVSSVSFKVSASQSSTVMAHAYVTNDYVDVIETGPKTNVLLDTTQEELDDSTQYFFGLRMRAFATYNANEGAYTITNEQTNTATQLSGSLYTYGAGGSTYGLGQLLDGLPTTGFLRQPSDIVVPVGSYVSMSGAVRYFESSSSSSIAVIKPQDGVVVNSSGASMNLSMGTPVSTTKIVMPLLYVAQAFRLSNNTWLWCYPMIYNAQGVPYGS